MTGGGRLGGGPERGFVGCRPVTDEGPARVAEEADALAERVGFEVEAAVKFLDVFPVVVVVFFGGSMNLDATS